MMKLFNCLVALICVATMSLPMLAESTQKDFELRVTGSGQEGDAVPNGGTISFGQVENGSNTSLIYSLSTMNWEEFEALSVNVNGANSGNFTVEKTRFVLYTNFGPNEVPALDIVFNAETVGENTSVMTLSEDGYNDLTINLEATVNAPRFILFDKMPWGEVEYKNGDEISMSQCSPGWTQTKSIGYRSTGGNITPSASFDNECFKVEVLDGSMLVTFEPDAVGEYTSVLTVSAEGFGDLNLTFKAACADMTVDSFADLAERLAEKKQYYDFSGDATVVANGWNSQYDTYYLYLVDANGDYGYAEIAPASRVPQVMESLKQGDKVQFRTNLYSAQRLNMSTDAQNKIYMRSNGTGELPVPETLTESPVAADLARYVRLENVTFQPECIGKEMTNTDPSQYVTDEKGNKYVIDPMFANEDFLGMVMPEGPVTIEGVVAQTGSFELGAWNVVSPLSIKTPEEPEPFAFVYDGKVLGADEEVVVDVDNDNCLAEAYVGIDNYIKTPARMTISYEVVENTGGASHSFCLDGACLSATTYDFTLPADGLPYDNHMKALHATTAFVYGTSGKMTVKYTLSNGLFEKSFYLKSKYDVSTGVDAVQSNNLMSISAGNGVISIKGSGEVKIFNLTGMELYSNMLDNEEATVRVAQGVYVVSVDSHSTKVVVK